jgi:hypothetical protein
MRDLKDTWLAPILIDDDNISKTFTNSTLYHFLDSWSVPVKRDRIRDDPSKLTSKYTAFLKITDQCNLYIPSNFNTVAHVKFISSDKVQKAVTFVPVESLFLILLWPPLGCLHKWRAY